MSADTSPLGIIRCMTCGYVLGTNVQCGPCMVEYTEAQKGKP